MVALAAIARSFHFQRHTLININSVGKSSTAGHYWLRPAGAGTGVTPRYKQICTATQQRPTWLPGLDPPTYLDGT